MGKGGLFAVAPSSPDEEDDDDLSDYAGDLEMGDPAEDTDDASGPFDAYAETAFDTEADPAARSDALRQAILTVLEESGRA
jgi:hypothetical protein